MRDRLLKRLGCAWVYYPYMFFPRGGFLSLAALFVAFASGAGAQDAPNSPVAGLSSAQIVEQIHLHEQARAQALKHYKATRHYAVQYHGFPADLAAGMVVEASFDDASGKSFRVVSQSGSKFLAERC